MNAVLIDSDVLIEVSRGREPDLLKQWGELSVSDSLIAVSPVTVAELWQGVRRSEEELLQSLFAGMVCLSIDADIGRLAGDLLRKYRPSHGLELGDALIAAAALGHEMPLWTRNRRHFPMQALRFYA